MSGKWEKTFEISVPAERVWEAVTNRETLQVLLSPPPGKGIRDGREGGAGIEVLEAVPLKKLRWTHEHDSMLEKAEFTIVFEDRETGSAITVTRFGFGEGEDADIFSKSNGLGWEHGFRDLVMYLETGHIVNRHYNGCSKSCFGMSYVETASGLEVCRVGEAGVAAEAGLQRGDRIVRLGGIPIYTRSDAWIVNSVYDPGTEVEVEFIRGRDLRHARGRTAPLEERLVGE